MEEHFVLRPEVFLFLREDIYTRNNSYDEISSIVARNGSEHLICLSQLLDEIYCYCPFWFVCWVG